MQLKSARWFVPRKSSELLGSTVNCAREAASLSREMELKVKIHEVLERLPGYFANGALADLGENSIHEFAA